MSSGGRGSWKVRLNSTKVTTDKPDKASSSETPGLPPTAAHRVVALRRAWVSTGSGERGPGQSPADVPAGGRHSRVERDVFAFCPAQVTSIGRLARLDLRSTRSGRPDE